MSAPVHAITALSLENFRNYRQLSLEISPAPVVLRGHNGAGKTNILEAISLLSPGRGLRHARLREMDALAGGGAPWVVAAELVRGEERCMLGTARDGDAATEKRLIKCNGEKIRAQAELTRHICVQWLTPAMDQVFLEGTTARRKLFDRIVFGFDHDHAARVLGYESAMRERMRLLTQGAPADGYWLSVLEQQMAEHAVAITFARLEVLGRLQAVLEQERSHFPRAQLTLEGPLEAAVMEGESALDLETKFAERLIGLRRIDAARGRVTEGVHRSRLNVIHSERGMPAEQCSTGEQKALLLSMVLAAATARAEWCGVAPILLLDEVIAHLDVDKRTALFDLICRSGIQAWMTGTDAADFQGLGGHATHLEIASGTVQMC